MTSLNKWYIPETILSLFFDLLSSSMLLYYFTNTQKVEIIKLSVTFPFSYPVTIISSDLKMFFMFSDMTKMEQKDLRKK